MQFAGIRTDLNLKQIGEPMNIMVKLNDDTLPSPEAVMVTGITPQSTLADGLTEAEFARFLKDEVFVPGTITVGFNNVRFDDEFIRHLFWRTFNDPYDWCWKDDCSRWDLLDVVRMTRALRPDGVTWPVDAEGRATNRLELLTSANGIDHAKAHDALSDVEALIDVAGLLKRNQPKLFDFLFTARLKGTVQKLVNLESKQPFVYTSGRYDAAHDKTTVAFPLTAAPNGNVVVYDLRHDPTAFIAMSQSELHKRLFASWEERKADGFVPVPVKTLQYNRCPAVAPVGVLEQSDGWSRIDLSLDVIERHKQLLLQHPDFAERVRSATEDKPAYAVHADAEARLYDGFINGPDKLRIETVRNAGTKELADYHPSFDDDRLTDLLLRYKARNFPASLSEDEVADWEVWRSGRLAAQLPGYLQSLQRLSKEADDEKRFLLEELQLWAEGILPAPEDS